MVVNLFAVAARCGSSSVDVTLSARDQSVRRQSAYLCSYVPCAVLDVLRPAMNVTDIPILFQEHAYIVLAYGTVVVKSQ